MDEDNKYDSNYLIKRQKTSLRTINITLKLEQKTALTIIEKMTFYIKFDIFQKCKITN